jgi:hypothetical protein
MRNEAAQPTGGLPAPSWQDALDELERALRDASWAITLLKRSLLEENAAPPRQRPSSLPPPPEDDDDVYVPAFAAPAAAAPAPPSEEQAPADDSYGRSTFERLWDRIERERMEKAPGEGAVQSEPLRGLDLLPQQYLMTVEDRESRVDLVPLHRALLSIAGMDDVTLVTYANGVPVISIRVQGELDLEKLQNAVALGMDRECEVIPQENNKLFIRLRVPQEAERE